MFVFNRRQHGEDQHCNTRTTDGVSLESRHKVHITGFRVDITKNVIRIANLDSKVNITLIKLPRLGHAAKYMLF